MVASRSWRLAACWLLVAANSCASTPDRKSKTLAPRQSASFCAATNPCPGLTAEKLRVCGECDPSTRYFRRAICSLGSKLRTAVDACVSSNVNTRALGHELAAGTVRACVRRRLVNDPDVLRSYIRVAERHEVTADEQKRWRSHCEARWAEHLNRSDKKKQEADWVLSPGEQKKP